MESHGKISPSTHIFLTKFKVFLESTGLTSQEFFNNFQKINNNQMSKLQFFRMIGLLHIENQNNFDPQQAFQDLSRKQMTIQIPYITKLLTALTSLTSERKKSEEKIREDQMQKKMIRIGLYRLQQFMKNHPNALGFLKEFDGDNNNCLDKTQFNRMLVATDIKELSNRDIRRILIEHIYKYYKPRKQITMKELTSFFQVECKVQMPRIPIFHKPPNIPYVPYAPNGPKIQKERTPNKTFDQSPKIPLQPEVNPFGKKKNQQPIINIHDVRPVSNQKKKNISPQINEQQNHISNCSITYPKAIKFYRNCDPSPSEHECMQQLQQLLTQSKKYIDKQNPATIEGSYVNACDIFKTEKYHMFQMASSVLVRQVSRIGIARQIQPKDIIQGAVGDCYFLSSIASIISIFPELIAERFLFDKNPANYYAVKLFVDGEWKIIKTDDRFPCRGNTPLFAKPHTQQIWVMLLQKCWAKVFGSFKAIQSGSSKQGFMALTGAPCQMISQQSDKKGKKEQDIIKQIENAQRHRYVATMSGSAYLQGLGKIGEEKYGLVSGHAYSLLKLVKIGDLTLVKMRNPWGKTTWKGDWSFQSSLWTKQLRDRYNYNRNPDDGSFYMPWKQFNKYFGQIIVCKLNPTFLHSSIQVKTNRRKSAYILMKVKTPGQYIVSVYQQNKRKFINKYANYQYSQTRLVILKKEGKDWKFIGSKSTSSSQVCSVDIEFLEEGDYIISAKVWWKFWEDHQMIVTSYGTDYAKLFPLNRAIAPQFKQAMIHSYAKQFAGSGKIKSYEKYGFNATCQTYFDIEAGIGFVKMTNSSDKKFESIQEMKLKGVKLIKPDKLPLQFKMGPRSQKIYGFFLKASGYEYSSTEHITY